MIEAIDRDFMIAMIDLEKCIANNDVELAQSVCETINTMELEDEVGAQFDRVVHISLLAEDYTKADALKYVFSNLKYIVDRGYKLDALEAFSVLHDADYSKMEAFIERVVVDDLSFVGEFDQRSYATTLIRICSLTKRYDLMDVIRSKLAESEVS